MHACIGGGRQWGLGGALDIRWCTKLRRFIYDRTRFPICFIAALPKDLHLIGPELIVKIRVDIKRRKHTIHEIQTLNPT